MPEEKKKESRIMKVTLDKDEFEKYDKGIIHSNNGLRKESGALSALPDIAPISEDDLPQRTIIQQETVYLQPKAPSVGQMIIRDVFEIILAEGMKFLSDPRKREMLKSAALQLWSDNIKPLLASQKKKGKWHETKAERILAETRQKSDIGYQIETVNEQEEKIVVTGEQAEQLVNAMRKKASELSTMIFLLSNIVVKDEKSDSEYVIQDAIIKQLLSEEVTNTMQSLLSNRQLLDDGTTACFEDCLNGYIRIENQRLPIPELSFDR